MSIIATLAIEKLLKSTFRSLNGGWLPKRLYKAEIMTISAM